MRVVGVVQGVGFRPFVHRLATEFGLDGWVINDDAGVLIELDTTPEKVDAFVHRLRSSPPPLARIATISVQQAVDYPGRLDPAPVGFVIRSSVGAEQLTTAVPADVRTCEACLRELNDPSDRRYRHALINCTDCGPRFTIVRSLPYDRMNTTMAGFPLCAACTAEYEDPTSRRFHAEPVSCRSCGPRLRFVAAPTGPSARTVEPGEPHGAPSRSGSDAAHEDAHPDDTALEEAVEAIRAGRIIAVKGIGGYALVVDAANGHAVRELRRRKHRDEKPFALQVATIAMARSIVDLDHDEERALLGSDAPIVLACRSSASAQLVCSEVAPSSDLLGVMLPSTALHHLLAARFEGPLVLTSANLSDEPIVIKDDAAISRLSGVADGFLTHDREIHRRADDSIVRRLGADTAVVRRARGHVLLPLQLPASTANGPEVLGVGAELKNTVCLTRRDQAFVSTHLGDLEHLEAFNSFRETIGDLRRFLTVEPELIVHDLHPEYLSTKWATEQGVDALGVQHHHAHIASCLVDNGFDGRVLGVAFDGHGYGPDGTLWGGEFLIADFLGYRRLGHLRTVPLPGGTAAIRDPWRMAVSHLSDAYGGSVRADVEVRARHAEQWDDVARVAGHRSTIHTSSVGRLLDAVAAILGVCDRSSFEGQAAMALEQRAIASVRPVARLHATSAVALFDDVAPIRVQDDGDMVRLDPRAFVRSLSEHASGQRTSDSAFDPGALAWLAHRYLADASVACAVLLCSRHGLGRVALSGGVFQNALLVSMMTTDLERAGLTVLTHRRIPPNDGGISLGQVAIGRAALALR